MRNRSSALSRRSGDSVFWGYAFGACWFSGESLDLVKVVSPQSRIGGVLKTNRAQRVPFAAAPCGGRQVRRQAAYCPSCRRRRTLRFVRWRFFAGSVRKPFRATARQPVAAPLAEGQVRRQAAHRPPAVVGECFDSYDGASSQVSAREPFHAAARQPAAAPWRRQAGSQTGCSPPSCRRRRMFRFVRWRFFAGFGPRTVSCGSTAARCRPLAAAGRFADRLLTALLPSSANVSIRTMALLRRLRFANRFVR